MTVNALDADEPPASEDYFVQLLAFDKRCDAFTTADLGSWTTRSRDQAVERLRLYVCRARPHMSECAEPSAVKWIKSRGAARKLREALADGAMYVYVIADGAVVYEISARPVRFPSTDEDRIGTWTIRPRVPTAAAVANYRHEDPGERNKFGVP